MVTEFQREEILSQIQQLLIDCESDQTIMQKLELSSSTYYNYKRQLTDEYVKNTKSQRLEDYSLLLETYQGRLRKILHHILLRISDTSRISNRDLSTLSQVGREISAELLNCDSQLYYAVHPDKKKLPPTPGQPALTEESEKDMGIDWDPEAQEYVHSRSTDDNPIV